MDQRFFPFTENIFKQKRRSHKMNVSLTKYYNRKIIIKRLLTNKIPESTVHRSTRDFFQGILSHSFGFISSAKVSFYLLKMVTNVNESGQKKQELLLWPNGMMVMMSGRRIPTKQVLFGLKPLRWSEGYKTWIRAHVQVFSGIWTNVYNKNKNVSYFSLLRWKSFKLNTYELLMVCWRKVYLIFCKYFYGQLFSEVAAGIRFCCYYCCYKFFIKLHSFLWMTLCNKILILKLLKLHFIVFYKKR